MTFSYLDPLLSLVRLCWGWGWSWVDNGKVLINHLFLEVFGIICWDKRQQLLRKIWVTSWKFNSLPQYLKWQYYSNFNWTLELPWHHDASTQKAARWNNQDLNDQKTNNLWNNKYLVPLIDWLLSEFTRLRNSWMCWNTIWTWGQ